MNEVSVEVKAAERPYLLDTEISLSRMKRESATGPEPHFFAKPFGLDERLVVYRGCVVSSHKQEFSDRTTRPCNATYLYCFDQKRFYFVGNFATIERAFEVIDEVIRTGKAKYLNN